MPLFRRRREQGTDSAPAAGQATPAGTPAAADAPDTSASPDAAGPVDAAGQDAAGQQDSAGDAPLLMTTGPDQPAPVGPVDVAELDAEDRAARLDLGALLLPPPGEVLEGLEVQLQADEASGEVLAVLVVDGPESAVEMRAFAAPRSGRLWDQVRPEIAQGAADAGGQTAEALGAWGIELLVQVPLTLPDGQPVLQVSRIAGIDGPRWFLRATFLGRAAVEPETAGRLQAVVERVAVVRGAGPMAPRDPIPLTVPGQQPGGPLPVPEPPAGREPLEPFTRGPEITETR